MKKILYVMIFILLGFASCSQRNMEEKEKALSGIKSYFDELDSHSFDVSYPVKIDGQNCYKIVVTGKLNNGKTYPIDTIAVDLNNDRRYFYSPQTQQYVNYFAVPTFACQTSPDKKLRIESVGMTEKGDGPSGLYALEEMRVLDLSSGEVLWTDSSYLDNKFLWSEDSRFVAAECSGRQWTNVAVIDTTDFSSVSMPTIDDIRKVFPDSAAPNKYVAMPIFKIVKWVSPSVILINFEWATNNDSVITGEYEYDVANKLLDIKNIDEASRG